MRTMMSEIFEASTPALEDCACEAVDVAQEFHEVEQQFEVVEGLEESTAALESLFAGEHDTQSVMYQHALEAITRRIHLPNELLAPALESSDGKDNLLIRMYKAIKAALVKLYEKIKSFFAGIGKWLLNLGNRADKVEKRIKEAIKSKDAEIEELKIDISKLEKFHDESMDEARVKYRKWRENADKLHTDNIEMLIDYTKMRSGDLDKIKEAELNRSSALNIKANVTIERIDWAVATNDTLSVIELAKTCKQAIEDMMANEIKFKKRIDEEIELAKRNSDMVNLSLLERLAKERSKLSTKEVNIEAKRAAELIRAAEHVASSIKSKK